jgi:hypothetical protein
MKNHKLTEVLLLTLDHHGRSSRRRRLCDLFFARCALFFYLRALVLIGYPGLLFTHWIADSLTLWKSPVTDAHLWTAAEYYSVLSRFSPTAVYFIAAVASIGGLTMIWSFRDGEAGNLMFDGGSICGSCTFYLMWLY